MEDKKDAVAVQDGGIPEIPEFLKEYTGKGLEHISKKDLQIPRLALAQGTSPHIKEESPKYIDGLKLGQAFNTVTNQIYGKGPWEIAVVRAEPSRWMEWEGVGPDAVLKDPNVPEGDPRTKWRENGKRRPVATQYYDYIVVFLDTMEPVVLSFKSKGITVATKFNTLMTLRRAAPLFMGKYTMRAVMAPSPKGTYAAFAIANAGWVTEGEKLKKLAQLFDDFKDKDLVVEREPGQDDEEEGDDKL